MCYLAEDIAFAFSFRQHLLCSSTSTFLLHTWSHFSSSSQFCWDILGSASTQRWGSKIKRWWCLPSTSLWRQTRTDLFGKPSGPSGVERPSHWNQILPQGLPVTCRLPWAAKQQWPHCAQEGDGLSIVSERNWLPFFCRNLCLISFRPPQCCT